MAVIATRDPAAFAELYDRYFDAVYRYCQRRLDGIQQVEDATATIFTRALAAMPRYQPRGSFRSWLFSIAHNVVMDIWQRSGRETSLPEEYDASDHRPSPEDHAIAGEQRDIVRGLLAQLSDDQRQLVELRLAGLSGAEMQQVMGRSQSWVYTNQHRAMRRLRDLMVAQGLVDEGKLHE